MFNKIASIFVGVFFVGAGLHIAIKGGYYDKYGYYYGVGALKVPVGIILLIIGLIIIMLSLRIKHRQQRKSDPNEPPAE